MAFDIKLDDQALSSLVADFETLGREQRESQAAEVYQHERALEITESLQGLEADYQSTLASSHAEQAAIMTGMRDDLGRIREISESIPLRIIEPVMGIFNPRFSREKIAEEIKRKGVEADLAASQLQMRQNETASKAKSLTLELDRVEHETGIQQSEARAVAENLRTKLQGIESFDAVKQMRVMQSDEAGLKKMLADGELTQQEFDTALALRADQQLQRRLNRLAEDAALNAKRSRDIDKATTEQLLDPAFREKLNLSNEEARDVILRRESQRGLMETQVREASQARLDSIVALGSTTQLEEWIATAKDGLATITDASGRELGKMPLKRVMDVYNVSSQGVAERAMFSTKSAAADASIATDVTAIARASGIAIGENEDVWDTLDRALTQPDMPAAAMGHARSAAASLRAAAESSLPVTTRLQFKEAAAASVAEANKVIREAKLAGLPDTRTKEAMGAHLDNPSGRVTPEQGSVLLRHAIIDGASTGIGVYDTILNKLAIAVEADRTGGDKIKALQNARGKQQGVASTTLAAFLEKGVPLEESINNAINDPQVAASLQADLVQAVTVGAYAAAAESLRMPGLAAQLRTPEGAAAISGGETWNERAVLGAVEAEMRAQGQDVFEFVKTVRDNINQLARQYVTPQGPAAYVTSAINARLLKNSGHQWLAGSVRRSLDRAYMSLPRDVPPPTPARNTGSGIATAAGHPPGPVSSPLLPGNQNPRGVSR